MATVQMQLEEVPTSGIVGPFAEVLLRKLGQTLEFEGFTIRPESIELGQDIMNQTVALDFGVSRPNSPNGNESPTLTFTFSPDLPVDDNLRDFKEFVRDHFALAITPPSTRFSASIARIRPTEPPTTRPPHRSALRHRPKQK